jgi:hypothetical protein
MTAVNLTSDVLRATDVRSQNHPDAPLAFGEPVPPGTRLTLFSSDKPDLFFTVIKFWMDETSGIALALQAGLSSYQVEDGLSRRRLGGGGRKAERF